MTCLLVRQTPFITRLATILASGTGPALLWRISHTQKLLLELMVAERKEKKSNPVIDTEKKREVPVHEARTFLRDSSRSRPVANTVFEVGNPDLSVVVFS